MDAKGAWRFPWPVKAGSRKVSCWVKQPVDRSPRPQLAVLANPALGVSAELTADAPEGTDWVEVGPITFTATAAGVVYVELRARHDAFGVPCWWDDVRLK